MLGEATVTIYVKRFRFEVALGPRIEMFEKFAPGFYIIVIFLREVHICISLNSTLKARLKRKTEVIALIIELYHVKLNLITLEIYLRKLDLSVGLSITYATQIITSNRYMIMSCNNTDIKPLISVDWN